MTDGGRSRAGYALGLLTIINLLNYVERNAIFALFEPLKRDLSLTDAHLGWLASAYVLIFSIASLTVKLAALARGGNSLKLSRYRPTIA